MANHVSLRSAVLYRALWAQFLASLSPAQRSMLETLWASQSQCQNFDKRVERLTKALALADSLVSPTEPAPGEASVNRPMKSQSQS